MSTSKRYTMTLEDGTEIDIRAKLTFYGPVDTSKSTQSLIAQATGAGWEYTVDVIAKPCATPDCELIAGDEHEALMSMVNVLCKGLGQKPVTINGSPIVPAKGGTA